MQGIPGVIAVVALVFVCVFIFSFVHVFGGFVILVFVFVPDMMH